MAADPAHDLDRTELLQRWESARGEGATVQAEVLLAGWALTGSSAATQRRVDELVLRFAQRLTATGVPSFTDATVEDCENFLWTHTRRNKAPSLHTVHLRRTALRGVFGVLRQLDPTADDPTRGLDLPGKPERQARPLTYGELDLVRTSALGRTRRPLRAAALVALAEATATTGELPGLHWSDIDLTQATVVLPGAPPVQPRTGHLTTWGVGVLGRWQHKTPHAPDVPIAGPHSAGTTDYAAQAAMSSALSRLINSAGVTDPQVRPSSIRLWGGANTLAVSGIEAAARALGIDSLDATADALGHDWRTQS